MDKYAIFGNPVEHSLSPIIHDCFAKQSHEQFQYTRIKPSLDGFDIALQQFINDGGNGCNITFPFKGQAFNLSNEYSDTARDAEAASCLLVRDGAIFADNYDGTGLVQDLTHNHKLSLDQKNILIIGGGGATRGILGPLLATTPSKIIIANRTPQKATDLAERYKSKGHVTGVALNEIEIVPYDLIIHATTAGHQGRLISLPQGIIGHQTRCYDLSYGKAAEPFLHWAKESGSVQCIDGLGMLVEHNAAVFYLWRNIQPDTKPVIDFLRGTT